MLQNDADRRVMAPGMTLQEYLDHYTNGRRLPLEAYDYAPLAVYTFHIHSKTGTYVETIDGRTMTSEQFEQYKDYVEFRPTTVGGDEVHHVYLKAPGAYCYWGTVSVDGLERQVKIFVDVGLKSWVRMTFRLMQPTQLIPILQDYVKEQRGRYQEIPQYTQELHRRPASMITTQKLIPLEMAESPNLLNQEMCKEMLRVWSNTIPSMTRLDVGLGATDYDDLMTEEEQELVQSAVGLTPIWL